MTDRLDFERMLEARLRARASLASRPFDASAIAHQVVAAQTRPRPGAWRLADWPGLAGVGLPELRGARAAMGLVAVLALLLAALAVGLAIGSRLPSPSPQLTVVREHVDAVNAKDADAFFDTFTRGAVFGPGGDFRESSSLFGNSLPLADAPLVEAWMAIQRAWDLEAEIIACNEDADAAIMYGYGEGQGEPMVVNCEVATRWHGLSMEITERWSYEFHGSGLGHWGFALLDLNPAEHALPLGYDGLEAWEAWLQAADPEAAARYLNPRTAPDCDGCSEWQESLAPGDPERAAELARLLSTAENDWSIQGHDFAPFGLIPYDPAFAEEIEASIEEYLGSR